MPENTKCSILVVDDDRTNLDVLNHILKNEYTIYVAKSGEMALKRAMSDRPDLILLDIIMPDMSGYEVLKELKESDFTRDTPVIFITGLASAADEEKGFLMGAVDYIIKPFHNSIVKARVRTHLKTVRLLRTIEKMGTTDALTEIPNRRSFEERIKTEWQRAIRESEPMSVLFIDSDGFKQYNEAYGYLQGDVMLQTLAKTLVNTLKRNTDYVARTGRDEFRVVLPNTEREGAVRVAEEIRQAVETMEIPSMGSAVTSVTVSIGVATGKPARDEEYAELLAEAGEAMFLAKEQGRNRVSTKE